MTAPSVVYKVELNDGAMIEVDAPSKLVDADKRRAVSEPYVAMEMFAPTEYTGTLMELAQGRRGEYVDQKFMSPTRVSIKYNMPLAEVRGRYSDYHIGLTRL